MMVVFSSSPGLPFGSRSAPPRASAMIEALRGLGYSTATALADIIDNSISAGAASVALDFAWGGEVSHVSILDDGCGMDEHTLDRAMRLGDRFDLDKIWQNQGISTQLQDQIQVWAREVNDALHQSASGRMISEWAKKVECWEAVLRAPFSAPLTGIPELR